MDNKANDRQVGGDHYKRGGEEHWDRAWRLQYDPFQYIITKWVERWRDKGGVEDLKKAQHAIEKYIELVENGDKLNPDPDPLPMYRPDTELKKGQQTVVEWVEDKLHPSVKSYGAERDPKGWIGYTYEGGDADGEWFRCTKCRVRFNTVSHGNPNEVHTCTGGEHE
jgi:hypothetical protein